MHVEDPTEAMTQKYVISAVNVESLTTQFEQVIMYEHRQPQAPDAIILIEHRLAEKNLATITAKFKQHDWHLTALPAPQENGRAHAGVAIITRPGLRFQRHEQELAHWQQQGRLLVGSLVGPTGKLICELIGVYSFADPTHRQTERQQLIDQLEEWVAPRHRLPLAIMGDFNFNVHQFPSTARWLSAGLLVDAVEAHDSVETPTHVSGSKLDFALTTETLMKACVYAETQKEFTFPSHRGIQLHLQTTPQSLISYRNASPLPANRLIRLRLAQMPEANTTPEDYTQALTLGAIDTVVRQMGGPIGQSMRQRR